MWLTLQFIQLSWLHICICIDSTVIRDWLLMGFIYVRELVMCKRPSSCVEFFMNVLTAVHGRAEIELVSLHKSLKLTDLQETLS